MKYVVLTSPYLDEAHAVGVAFRRGQAVPVTDEQAAVLLKNPAFSAAPQSTSPQAPSIAPASAQVPSKEPAPEHQGEKE